MSKGSGAAVTGLVIGIMMAAVVGDIDTSDVGGGGGGDGASDLPTGTSAGIGSSSNGTSVEGTGWGLDVPGVIDTTGRGGQTVALTFSAGPDPRYTPAILDILADHGVEAVFCVIGTAAQEHPDLIRQIAAGGHVLCDNTMSYDLALAASDDATMRSEIGGALSAIQAAVPDASVPFFRAPGGNFSPELVDVAASFDQASLGWNVDPRDWETPGAAAISASVVDAVQPGSVVVLHDGGADRTQTVDALDGILDELTAEGYSMVIPAS